MACSVSDTVFVGGNPDAAPYDTIVKTIKMI